MKLSVIALLLAFLVAAVLSNPSSEDFGSHEHFGSHENFGSGERYYGRGYGNIYFEKSISR